MKLSQLFEASLLGRDATPLMSDIIVLQYFEFLMLSLVTIIVNRPIQQCFSCRSTIGSYELPYGVGDQRKLKNVLFV